MGHQIKIDADLNLSKLKKSFSDLSAMISGMSQKHAIELFDKDSLDFLRNQAKDALGFLKREYDGLTSKAEAYREELKKTAQLTDEHRHKETQLFEVEKKRAELMRDMIKLKEKMGSDKGSGFMGQLGGELKGLPGGGIISKLLGSGSLGAMAGLAGGAAIAGGAWHVYSQSKAGYDQYNTGLRSRVGLMGRGVKDYRGLNSGMAGLGYSPEDIRQAQLQSTDIFGRAGSSGAAVYDRARFAKSTGQDLGMVQGLGSGLRSSLGVQQGTKAFAELEASLISNKIKDAIGPYLETAASMLTDLNENGMNFDSSALTAMAALVNKRGMSPEAASRMITDFDSRIKGSSGELNAFFQSAFARGGVGVNRAGRATIGSSQEAVNLGLFGLDESKASQFMKPGELGTYKRLGLTGAGGMNKRFHGLQQTVEGMGFQGNDEGNIQKGLFLQRIFGTKSGAEGLKYYNAMGQASQARNPQDREKILAHIKDEFGSNEEKALKLQGDQKELLEKIGEAVSPGFQAANRALLSIDNTLVKIARKGFGIDIAEGPQEHQTRMLDQQGYSMDQIDNMSAEGTESAMGKIRGDIKRSQSRYKTNARGMSPDIAQAMFSQSVKEQGDMAEVLLILKQHLDIARQQLREQKKPPVSHAKGRPR